MFGTDSSEHKKGQGTARSATSQNNYGGYVKVDNALGATKTNIQIFHNGVAAGQNRFTSSYRSANSLQAQPLKLSQRVSTASGTGRGPQLVPNLQSAAAVYQPKVGQTSLELRKANFTLGNDNPAKISIN